MKLDAKSLEVLLKRGLGTGEISNEMNVKTDELTKLIQKVFSEPAAKTYLRRLAKNDKHHKTSQHALNYNKLENVNMTKSSIVPASETVETVEAPVAMVETVNTSEKVISLESLKEKESELQVLTANQEAAVKSTIQDYRSTLEELSSRTALLNSLMKQITQLKSDIADIEQRSINIFENHNIELDKLHVLQQELNKIRSEIANRSVINVFVYADGKINVESENSPIKVEFEGWKEAREMLEDKFEELINTLQLRQVKQLAMLICLPAVEDGFRYEITFDDSELESVYDLITES